MELSSEALSDKVFRYLIKYHSDTSPSAPVMIQLAQLAELRAIRKELEQIREKIFAPAAL